MQDVLVNNFSQSRKSGEKPELKAYLIPLNVNINK